MLALTSFSLSVVDYHDAGGHEALMGEFALVRDHTGVMPFCTTGLELTLTNQGRAAPLQCIIFPRWLVRLHVEHESRGGSFAAARSRTALDLTHFCRLLYY